MCAVQGRPTPYLVYLRHPTTGGVFASWGSLGQVTVAEPGAMVGFLGARVYEALYGRTFPEGVQTAENLFEHGLIDAILPVEAPAETADRALNVLMGPCEDPPEVPDIGKETLADAPAWDSITRSRRHDRPGVRALLARQQPGERLAARLDRYRRLGLPHLD